MAIQRTFTGENTGIKIQPLDRLSRSQERMDDMLTRADEIRFSTFKESQKRFLDTMNVDMETYISTANAEAQSKLLDEYNTKAKKILDARGGRFENFNGQDWLELQKGRKYLESAQAKMKTDLEKFKMDEQIVKRDGGRTYDIKEWDAIKSKYLQTGVYSEDPLPVKEKSLIAYLSERSKLYTGKYDVDLQTEGGQKRTASYNMPKDLAQSVIADAILSDDGIRKYAMRTFAELPIAEKVKWLDTNKDGKVDDTERQNENGVIKWATQNEAFINSIRRENGSTFTGIGGSKSNASGDFVTFDIGMGTPIKYQPTERQSFKDYKTYHTVPEWPVMNIPADNITVQKPTGEKVKVVGKTLSLQLTGYDEEKDEFTFITKGNYYGANTMGAGDQIAIARKDVPPKFNDFTIMVNGSKVKVGEIKRDTNAPTAQTKKMSFVEWKKTNPTGTPQQFKAYMNG